MADRIQLRRDTAANWTAYNPILLEGEPGIEIDTDQWKLGDGVHTWSQLAYRGGECVQQRGQSTTVAMSQKAVTDELNLIGVFDISAHNLTDGQPTKYADLTAALGTHGDNIPNVPESYRRGGMTIRFVQSSDNKYVQYLYHGTSTDAADFTNTANWEKINLEEELIDKTGILNISKNLTVTASQRVYLQEKDWGKNVAIRVLSNTATMGDAVIKADLRYSGSSIKKNLSSNYAFFEYSSNFNRIYIYVEGTPSSAGEVEIEIVYGNSYYLVSVDSEPVKDSKHLIESGTVYNGLYDLETKKVISKSVTVKSSQQIYLHSANYGKRIALRAISNPSGGVLQCGIYSAGPNVYKTITSDYIIHDSATDITGLYIYLENATSAGEVEVELLYGDSADILVLQRESENIEKQVTDNHNNINYIIGGQTPIVKNYVAGESSQASVSSRINTFIPKGSKIIIKGASISSGLFAETVSNLTLYIIYSTPNNVDDTAIRYLQNKTNYEIIAPADIYAFAFTAFNSSDVAMSAVTDGSITMNIESVYTPVKNGMSIDLLQGGVSLDKRYLSGTSASLNQNNRADIFIPKGSKIKLDYDISSGLFGSATISTISLYLLTSKDAVTSPVIIKYFQNKRGIEVTLEKDIYGLCMAVYDANDVALTTTKKGNITYIVGYVYTNGYCGSAVEALGFDTRLDVPSYYQSGNYLKNKVERIKQISANNVGDNFIFITDTHWDRNAQKSVALLKYLDDNGAYYKRIVNGGDISQVIAAKNASLQSINEIEPARIDYIKLLSQLKKKVYYTIGNHEYLTEKYPSSGLFDNVSFDNWHDYLYYPDETDREVVFGNSDKHYYYLDNKKSKIRYIFLSSFKKGEEQSVSGGFITTAVDNYDTVQLNWFENTALNVESGWDIIVFTHMLVSATYTNQSTNDQSFYVKEKEKEFCKALLQYSGNGNILAVIAGHTHRDGMVVINDSLLELSGASATGNQIPEIITTCDANNFDNLPHEALQNRDSGTINEQAFDYVVVNKTSKRITLIRIGAPANNVVDYSGTLQERTYACEQVVLSVSQTTTLDSKLSGTVTWQSSDDSVVSVADGTVTGVATGVARITATNNSNCSVVFMIKVA